MQKSLSQLLGSTATDLRRTAKLVATAAEIAEQSAHEADELAFLARFLCQTSIPHSDPGDVRMFKRSNGDLSLKLIPDPEYGIPYGSYPRLVLAWICTEAVRTRRPTLILGDSLSDFMGQLGLIPTGGRWGTITRLRDQMQRLIASNISVTYDSERGFGMSRINPVDEARLWWDAKRPAQGGLWQSELELNMRFYRAILHSPVPMDMRVLRAVKRSPLSLDVYAFLSHRMGYLKDPLELSWDQLHDQLGADYANTKHFAAEAKRALRTIRLLWADLRYETPRGRLVLYPSPLHVARIARLRDALKP